MKRDHKLAKKGILQISAGLLIAATVPFLLGCSSHKNTKAQIPVKPTQSQLRQCDLATLRANGVQVIHLGETYRLVISSSYLFNPDSANLTSKAKCTLNTVARLLNSYHILTVRVAAYSDSVKPGVRKDALTQRQADVIQGYLTDRGLKARLIFAAGEGDKNPVAWNGTSAGKKANRRVEIRFMYLPRKTIYE